MAHANCLRPAMVSAIACLLLGAQTSMSQTVSLSSPGGNVSAQVKVVAGQLTYNLVRDGVTVIEDSRMGITVNSANLGLNPIFGTPTTTVINQTYASNAGVHATTVNYCNETTLPVIAGGRNYNLVLRLYDDGLAYRYVVPGSGTQTVNGESTSWKLPQDSMVYYQNNTAAYEGDSYKATAQSIGATYTYLGTTSPLNIGGPFTAKLPNNGGYVAITEGALYKYSGMTYKSAGTGTRTFNAQFEDNASGWSVTGTVTTPWRLAITSQNLNGLVNSDMVANVNPAPSTSTDWSFVKPGRSVWSWWSNSSSPRDYNTQIRFIDQAAQLGFQYTLLDEGWEQMANLDTLLSHASSKNVGVWVWKSNGAWSTDTSSNSFFNWCKTKGIKGVKIDFMDSESRDKIVWYEQTLQAAAKFGIMVNFHGANKPTGESRQYPNEMTREGIKGLEHSRDWYWFHGANNTTMPFTRFLAGAGDFTPCTLDPAHLPYMSFAHQLATTIVFTSPVTHWADDPSKYLTEDPANRHLDVLKYIPTMWDETVVLPGSEPMSLAAYARRTGADWFIGVLNGELPAVKNLNFDLTFLTPGTHYKAILLKDNLSTNVAFLRQDKDAQGNALVLSAADALNFAIRGDGGFVARLIALTPGDANADGKVDVGDLGVLGANYGGSGKKWVTADFNDDGQVDVGDLGILGANYGQTTASQVPEPATLSLLVLGLLGLRRR